MEHDPRYRLPRLWVGIYLHAPCRATSRPAGYGSVSRQHIYSNSRRRIAGNNRGTCSPPDLQVAHNLRCRLVTPGSISCMKSAAENGCDHPYRHVFQAGGLSPQQLIHVHISWTYGMCLQPCTSKLASVHTFPNATSNSLTDPVHNF